MEAGVVTTRTHRGDQKEEETKTDGVSSSAVLRDTGPGSLIFPNPLPSSLPSGPLSLLFPCERGNTSNGDLFNLSVKPTHAVSF